VRLKAAHITNYRSIRDTGEFSIDDVTCLVGKNESGKTAILQALYRLNPYGVTNAVFDKDLDYPRGFKSKYAETHGGKEAMVVDTTWEIEEVEVRAVEQILCPDALKNRTVKAYKFYGQTNYFWSYNFNEPLILKTFAAKAQLSSEELAQIEPYTTVEEATKAFEGAELTPGLAALRNLFAQLPKGSLKGVASAIFPIPEFLYFGNYERMSGAVALHQLAQDKAVGVVSPGDDLFLDFLALSGTSVADIQSAERFEALQSDIEAASHTITDEIFEYWTQNRHLKLKFAFSNGLPQDKPPFDIGPIIRARVDSEAHRASVPFEERSTGFVWFFSFLVKFSQMRKKQGRVIILLDEPGLTLHGRAQTDLLRYFEEKLRPRHQVIYTTHSPFMVPATALHTVRTVEDVLVEERGRLTSLGTHVGDEVLSNDPETLFPLQGALGYEITQSLFVGKKALLVDSPADVLMLQAASAELNRLERTGLDPSWTLVPTGSLGKVPSFVALFGVSMRANVSFSGYARGDEAALERVRELLTSERVLTANSYCSLPEADTEDLLGPEIYAAMLNGALGVPRSKQLNADKLTSDGTHERMVDRARELIGGMGLGRVDRYKLAAWLFASRTVWNLPSASEALDRFETLFEDINAIAKQRVVYLD
jgi:predicted ATPase